MYSTVARHRYNSRSNPPDKPRAPTVHGYHNVVAVTPRDCSAAATHPARFYARSSGHRHDTALAVNGLTAWNQETNSHHVVLGVVTEVARAAACCHTILGKHRLSLSPPWLRFQNQGRGHGAVLHGSAPLPRHTPLRGDCPSPDVRPHFFHPCPFLNQH